jgi:hypothetical protein
MLLAALALTPLPAGRWSRRNLADLPGFFLPQMLPPYESHEVARAVERRLAQAGIDTPTIQVIADLRIRRWIVSARWAGGRLRGSYPFSDASGVHTPREIAEWVARETPEG